MERATLDGLFALIPVLKVWQLPNGYLPYQPGEDEQWTRANAVYRASRPWWLVKTKAGCIEIGWRKRVINIDWSDTPFRGIITADETTKAEDMVHAWTELKAVEYLQALGKHLA